MVVVSPSFFNQMRLSLPWLLCHVTPPCCIHWFYSCIVVLSQPDAASQPCLADVLTFGESVGLRVLLVIVHGIGIIFYRVHGS